MQRHAVNKAQRLVESAHIRYSILFIVFGGGQVGDCLVDADSLGHRQGQLSFSVGRWQSARAMSEIARVGISPAQSKREFGALFFLGGQNQFFSQLPGLRCFGRSSAVFNNPFW